MTTDRVMLIYAIVGRGFPSWRFADEMVGRKLARFSGNRWNEDWDWYPDALARLTTEELEEIYRRVME